MSQLSACPQCTLENTCRDSENFVCPDGAHEWPAQAVTLDSDEGDGLIRDAHGNPLADGDAVILIKDLKVRSSSTVLKKGSKIKSIRLVVGDHAVDCKMDVGSVMLKACFLKNA